MADELGDVRLRSPGQSVVARWKKERGTMARLEEMIDEEVVASGRIGVPLETVDGAGRTTGVWNRRRTVTRYWCYAAGFGWGTFGGGHTEEEAMPTALPEMRGIAWFVPQGAEGYWGPEGTAGSWYARNWEPRRAVSMFYWVAGRGVWMRAREGCPAWNYWILSMGREEAERRGVR